MLETWQWNTVIFSTLIKLSLIPSYHSTDFEVHRHWLALTNTLPISQWYFDETSQWTLDYPPFFAYFSWVLSIPAKLWDPRIVDLQGELEYDSWKCVLYMRLTVIVTELVLAGALFALSRQAGNTSSASKVPAVIAAALLLHPGLIIVDHIHFQYNGFLFGILLWSIWAAREVSSGLDALFLIFCSGFIKESTSAVRLSLLEPSQFQAYLHLYCSSLLHLSPSVLCRQGSRLSFSSIWSKREALHLGHHYAYTLCPRHHSLGIVRPKQHCSSCTAWDSITNAATTISF